MAGTGGRGASLASAILESSLQLDIPPMFAALLFITLAGVLLSGGMALLSRALLGWHEPSRDEGR